MKLSFARDIPRGAASVAVALALITSVVVGRDEPAASGPQADRAPEPPPAAAQASLPDLDLEKLNRNAKTGKIADLFAPKTAMLAPPPPAAAAAAPPPPPPPPAPTTPALPFRYFGKWVDGGKAVVFLSRNSESYSVSAGETVDGTYRIESITDASVDFIYLPLGTKQTLPIAEPN